MSGFERYRGNIQRIRQVTAPINITDIMVAPYMPKGKVNYLGEFEFPGTNNNQGYQPDLKTRIGDHIEHLALMANKEHEKANIDTSTGSLKPGSENNVTRLSTNEFSFYPKGRPLTLDEYRALLVRFREIAGKCHENLHLLLASFPVEWPDKKVYNIVVHVQCGKDPVLSPFAKSVPSAIDALYPGTSNPSFVGTSFYPKVLSEGINLSLSGNTEAFDDVVRWITDGSSMTAPEAADALMETKNALLNDKHCPPPKALIDCIDATVLAFNNNGALTTIERDNFIDAMNNFKTTMEEESARFDDAANLAPPRPYIISNGIATDHHGRFSFQKIIDFINECDGDLSKNDKALEILQATKKLIEQGRIANPDYTIDPKLIGRIDKMITKINLGVDPLNSSDIAKFETKMDEYRESCQTIYRNFNLQAQRPGIISDGFESSLGHYASFDGISALVKEKSKVTNFHKGELFLTELKANIEDYNSDNTHYAPDSTDLLAHIDAMLLKYSTSAIPLPNSDFTDLEAELKQYKVKCQSRYSDYVRSVMPKISNQIGSTANYGEGNDLTKIAALVKNNLDQVGLIRSSRNQLDYLRDNLLFSVTERNKSTQHTLLKTIETISGKLDKLIIADQLLQEHYSYKNIDDILKKTPLKTEDKSKIFECLMKMQAEIGVLKNHYSAENVAIQAIENKFSGLVDAFNQGEFDSITLQKADLDTFKEGYDALGVLLKRIPIDYSITIVESNQLKLDIENYATQPLRDKIEKSIEEINLLIKANKVYQTDYDKLQRTFTYLNAIEALSPECKKAITAIKDKLDNKQEVDPGLISTLKNELLSQNALVEKMPYWHFPTQMLSQDIMYDSTVQCRTQNAEWWTNINVCLDELYAIRFRNYLNAVALESMGTVYSSEMNTSNSVNTEEAHAINPKGFMSHADVKTYRRTNAGPVTKKYSTKTEDTLMGTRDLATGKTLGLNTMNEAITVDPKNINNKYKTTIDDSDPDQLVVKKAIFGPDLVMRKYDTHALRPLPIANNKVSSVDTYTANFYIRRLDAILKSLELPKDAVKQRQYLNEFSADLDKLKNNHAAKVNNFYDALKSLEEKVKLIPSDEENTDKCMHQIALMRHYIDTKMVSLESYIIFRDLEKIKGTLTPEQEKIVKEFEDDLNIIQNKPVTFDSSGQPIMPANEIATAVFNFRNKITANSEIPQDVTKLLAAYEQAKEYLRSQYPEVYSELIRKRFPEFAKVLDLVKPVGSGLTDKQANAIKELKRALRDIEMQSLRFDPKGRPILETYDLEKALKNFNTSIESIKGEDTTALTQLSEAIQKHVEQLQNEFKALNLGQDYYDKQLAAIEAQQKNVRREINLHEGSKSQASLSGGNKWQYRDVETQTLESGIQEKLKNYLKMPKLNSMDSSSPAHTVVNQVIDALENIKGAVGEKTKKSVVMTDDLIKILIYLQKSGNMVLPDFQTVYKDIIGDLSKQHPEIYRSLMIAVARDQLVDKHKGLSVMLSDYKDRLKNAFKQKARLEDLETTVLPKAEKDLNSIKIETDTAKQVAEEEAQIHSEILELQKTTAQRQKEFLTQQEQLQSAIKILKSDNQHLMEGNEKLQGRIIKLQDYKSEVERFSEDNKKIMTLSEALQQNNDQQETLRSSNQEIELKLQTLPSKLPDLIRRNIELNGILYENQAALLDRQKRLTVLGPITEKNQHEATRLENDIRDLKKRIELSQSEINKLTDKIADIKQTVEELQQQQANQKKLIKSLESESTKLTQELEVLNSQRKSHQEKMAGFSHELFGQEKQALQQLESTVLLEKITQEIVLTEKNILSNQHKISENIVTMSQRQSSVDALQKLLEQADHELRELRKKEDAQNAIVKDKTSLYEGKNSELQELEKQVQLLTAEKDEIKLALNTKETSIKHLQDQVEIIGAKFESLDSQMEKHKEQQQGLDSNIGLAKSDKKDLDEKHESYTQRRSSM